MRKLWAITLVLIIGGSGWWWVGSRAALNWAEALVAEGRTTGQFDATDVTMEGYPARFDLTFDKPVLRSPNGVIEWRADVFQLMSLSYTPHHLIGWWSPEQSLRIAGHDYALKNEDMRASLKVKPRIGLPLDEAVLVVEAPRIGGSEGQMEAREARAAIKDTDADAAGHPTYQLGVELLDLSLPEALTARLQGTTPAADPSGTRPDSGLDIVQWARLDARVGLDRVLDNQVAVSQPRLMSLDLRALSLGWGDITLEAKGALTVTATGQPEGTVEVTVTGWKQLLAMAVAAKILPQNAAQMGEGMLAMLAKGQEAVTLPLVFQGGRMSLGPIPLGMAPVLQQPI
jgi:hypothetical protein